MSARCVALVGNPNCGKTTLFNALTRGHQQVGNWSGVTVERVSGSFTQAGQMVELVDLPGTYSLNRSVDAGAMDECLACDFILNQQTDVIINVVDASHLERHLYLTLQLLEMGLPVVLALNMMDVARAQGIQIDTQALRAQLGCQVVALEANRGLGLAALREAVVNVDRHAVAPALVLPYPEAVQAAMIKLSGIVPSVAPLQLLEGETLCEQVAEARASIKAQLQEEADIIIADTRYRYIQQLLQTCQALPPVAKVSWRTRIDNVVLNRVLGIPIFLGVMYLLFVFAIGVGGYFQAYVAKISDVVFVQGVSTSLQAWGASAWVVAVLADGLGNGVKTVLTFMPVIGAMFVFLAVLEESGYMARAAFVVDRLMRALGLPGKAFVPMIVGFGCNVPAIMAARSLEHQRDRILTIMMSPFMSCGARLAIYAIFAASFFPQGGQNVVFALYLIGIVMAVFTGFILQRTVLQGEPAALVMELPAYHLPQVRTLLMHAWRRLHGFVFRAGKIIVPICMLIGALNMGGGTNSPLAMLGQWASPIFAPLGIQADNWPATVGLVTGVLAKEVVIGTLSTLYAQMGQVTMVQMFDGRVGAFAYLLFVLLYFPCVSTMAVMLRELHRGWTVFSACWMTGMAYGMAVLFYQTATWARHPGASLLWLVGIVGGFLLTLFVLRRVAAGLPVGRGGYAPSCVKTLGCGGKCLQCPTVSNLTYEWPETAAILKS